MQLKEKLKARPAVFNPLRLSERNPSRGFVRRHLSQPVCRWLVATTLLAATSASGEPIPFIFPNVPTLDFGTTTVGTPIRRTVEVKNVGDSDLFLFQVNLPPGFTEIDPISPFLPIPPQTFVQIFLQLDAEAAGTFSGTVVYETNAVGSSAQGIIGVVEEEVVEPPPVQVVMVQPNADAHVVQELPDKNVGTQPILRIRSPNSGAGRHSFLRFNVPPLSGSIVSAVLRIRPQTATITAAQVYDVNIGWGERNITWNNWLDGGTTFTFLRGTGVLAGEQWHEIDVHEAIPTNGGTVTIGLTTNSTTAGFRFYSRESAFVPTLEITTE